MISEYFLYLLSFPILFCARNLVLFLKYYCIIWVKEIKQYFGYDQSKSSNYYAMVSDLSIRYAFYIMFCSKREETKQQSMMQILMDFYEELFDDWLSIFIDLKLRSGISKFLEFALKREITDLRILYRDLDQMLIDFFEKEFYPDKIVEIDKSVKGKIA